jgi:ABC-type uncharacterized transport system substrate-binding protein
MPTTPPHRTKHLWLLLPILLVLVQPAAWSEGNTRKVGLVTFSVDPAGPSPLQKRTMDMIRATVPDLNVTFDLRSAEGRNDRYPQIMTDLVQQKVDVIFAVPGPAAVAAHNYGPRCIHDRCQSGDPRPGQEP